MRLEILFTAPTVVSVRTDRLLAAELGVSRSRLARLAETDRVILMPETRRSLQRPIKDGARIVIDLSAEADWAEIVERAQGGSPPA